jgi:hypothetical protein
MSVQSFLSRHWVSTNDRVSVRDGIATDGVLASEGAGDGGLSVHRVNGGEGFEVGGEGRGEAAVSLYRTTEER